MTTHTPLDPIRDAIFERVREGRTTLEADTVALVGLFDRVGSADLDHRPPGAKDASEVVGFVTGAGLPSGVGALTPRRADRLDEDEVEEARSVASRSLAVRRALAEACEVLTVGGSAEDIEASIRETRAELWGVLQPYLERLRRQEDMLTTAQDAATRRDGLRAQLARLQLGHWLYGRVVFDETDPMPGAVARVKLPERT